MANSNLERRQVAMYAVNNIESLAKETTPEAALNMVFNEWAKMYPDRSWFVNTTQEAMSQWGRENRRKVWKR